MIRAKAAEYMERAEKLKNHLADQEDGNRKKPSAMGSNGKVANGGGKGKYVVNTRKPRRMAADVRMIDLAMMTMMEIQKPRSSEVHSQEPSSQRSQTSNGRTLRVSRRPRKH